MRKRNGFTLVELLAVIVILAIIMVIAIPSVLDIMNTARRKTFALYIDKVVTAVQEQYLYDANAGEIQGAGYYVYDITQDLGLTTTGSYTGYVVIDASYVDDPQYYIDLYDNNYMIYNYNVTEFGMPTSSSNQIIDLETDSAGYYTHPYDACAGMAGASAGADISCYTRQGLLISSEGSNRANS